MLVLVAGKADTLGAFTNQGVLVIAAVRVVALHAPAFHRRMNMRFGRKLSLLILMAGIAGVVAFGGQELGEVRGMVGVTGGTVAYCDRAMFNLAVEDCFLVTFKTEILSLPQQLVVVSRLVRAVASGTVAILHRFVYHRSKMQLVVAGITERCYIGNWCELVLPLFVLLMAERTIPGSYRSMDIFIFAHLLMTFGSRTALSIFQRKT